VTGEDLGKGSGFWVLVKGNLHDDGGLRNSLGLWIRGKMDVVFWWNGGWMECFENYGLLFGG
jgi:hypothetical protein